jgi:hypothetical protein
LDLTILRESFPQTGVRSCVLKTESKDMQDRACSFFFSGMHAAKESGIALFFAQGPWHRHSRPTSAADG